MRIPGTRRARLIVFISLAALAVAIGLLLFARARALYQNIGPLLVAELERQLGREVAIGRVDASRPGRVVLEEVALASGERLASGTLFRADRIVLNYSWMDLIWLRTDVAGSVRRVLIENPFLLLVRDRTGRLNIQDLFKPRAPGAPPTRFRAEVVVTSGRLVFRDYGAALQQLPAENEVGGIDGVLDYRTFPRLTVRATGQGRRARLGLIRTSMFLDSDDGQWLLRAAVSNADAAYWTAYATRTPAVRVLRGRANLELVVSRSGVKAPVEYVADVAAAGVDARVAPLGGPVRSVRGFAQVTPYGARLEVTGSVAGMPVQVSGNVLDWKSPQLALSVRGSGVTLAAVRQVVRQVPRVPEFQVLTPGQVQAWILGPASRLYATGTLSVPAMSWRGERVRNARVAWRYHADMLQFDQVSAEAAQGGRLAATGWVQLQPSPARVYVTGRLENVSLAAIPGVAPQQNLRGLADAQFAVSGTSQNVRAAATVHLSRLAYNQARLESAEARLDYEDGTIYVRALQAEDERGQLVAAGTVGRRGELDLQVRARGIDLAALMAPFTEQPVEGVAFFAGTLGGTVREPRLGGELQLYAGRIGAFSTDYAEGQLVVRPNEALLESMELRLYPGQVIVKGTIGRGEQGRPRLDLSAEVQELRLERLLAMANIKTPVTGSVTGDLTLRGDPTLPVATGTVRIEELVVDGSRLGTATARLETEGGRLWVRQATLEGEPLVASAQGYIGLVAPPTNPQVRTITAESPVRLSFAVQQLDLERMSRRLPASLFLQGLVKVTEGQVQGRVGAPIVTARADVAPITVNGVQFAGLTGRVTYTAERVTVQDVVLRQNGGTVQVAQASLEPKSEQPMRGLTATAVVSQFPVQQLVEVAENTTALRAIPRQRGRRAAIRQTFASRAAGFRTVEGPISGTVTARPDPDGESMLLTAALNAPKLTIPGYRLAPVTGPTTPAESEPLSVGLEAEATYSTAGRIMLDRLSLTRDEGVLQARGTMVLPEGRTAEGQALPEGRIELRVDASDIPIGLFGPLVPDLHPLRGVGELHLDAVGPLRSPTIQASLDVDRLTLAGVPFSHLAIPYLQVAPGQIEIQNARLDMATGQQGDGAMGRPGEKTSELAPSPLISQTLLSVAGTAPFRWEAGEGGFIPSGRVPPDEPLALTVEVPEQSLQVLNSLSNLDPQGLNPRARPIVAALGGLSAVSGQMAAKLRITGTRARPDANGSFSVRNAAFQPQQGQTRFEQIAVQLDFTGNRVEVVQLRGRSSNGGTFEGSGDISGIALRVGEAAPNARLNLALSLNDLRYTERNLTGYLQERFRGTLRTVNPEDPDERAPLRLVGEWPRPALQGAVQVRDARLQLPGSFPETQARQAALPVNPQFNLDLLLGRDVWLEAPRMRLQLAGRLPIRGTAAEPTVRGRLRVERGQLIFPTARFRVEGEVEVAYSPGEQGGGTPLRVDLTATARLRGIDRATGQRQRYDVTLEIEGPLTADAYDATGGLGDIERPAGERLTIEARSDPPLSEQQVLALLGRQSAVESILAGGRDTGDVLRSEIENVLVASVVPSVFLPLETAIEDWLGLEEFSVDFALREPLEVRLTKQVWGDLYATYTQSLDTANLSLGPNIYSLELNYRFSERFRIGYRMEEPSRDRAVLLQGTFRF